MSKKIRTHYDNLGVSRNAQPEVIKAAYKALAQKYHPDRNPNNPDAERIMKIINTAYQVLIDPVSRAEHDRWINEQEAKIHTEQPKNHQHNHTQTRYDYAQNNAQQSTHHHRYNTGKNSKQNGATQKNKSDKVNNNPSIFSTLLIPIIITSFFSTAFKSMGMFLGFFGFIALYAGYSVCYHLTYKKIKAHRFIKGFLSIIAGIVGMTLSAFAIVFFHTDIDNNISTINHKQQSEIIDRQQPTQSHIPTDTFDFTENSQPTIDNTELLNQAKADYKTAIDEINRMWKQLHPSVQNHLQSEQIEFNEQRQKYCKEQSMSIDSDHNGREAYRYFCATQLLNERIEYLKTQLNTVITPPAKPQSLPKTGATNKPNLHGDSPLQIKTNEGSHYWVKIVDAYNERDEIASYFIRGGETLNVNLPTGRYIIKYAYGDTWYGEDDLFGKNTQYSKADEIFNFYYGSGYTIELIQQLNGNLHTTAIDESQF